MPDGRSPDQPVMTENLLLEYGEFSLEQIFMHQEPPILPSEIHNFWSHLIKVVDALSDFQNLKIGAEEYNM